MDEWLSVTTCKFFFSLHVSQPLKDISLVCASPDSSTQVKKPIPYLKSTHSL